ncbi:hypothetical protein ADUPG1_006221, partial [Aduncisulcus paluster]
MELQKQIASYISKKPKGKKMWRKYKATAKFQQGVKKQDVEKIILDDVHQHFRECSDGIYRCMECDTRLISILSVVDHLTSQTHLGNLMADIQKDKEEREKEDIGKRRIFKELVVSKCIDEALPVPVAARLLDKEIQDYIRSLKT